MVIKASGHTWGAGERPEFIDHYFGMRAEAKVGCYTLIPNLFRGGLPTANP